MQLFTNRLQSKTIFFKHARGISDQSGKEFHPYHEIILFLGKEATFITESIHTPLTPNTLVLIPKETYHQLVVHGDPNEYYRCILQFEETADTAGLVRDALSEARVLSFDREVEYLVRRLMQLAAASHPRSDLLLQSCLILLLDKLTGLPPEPAPHALPSELIQNTIHYINTHPGSNITIPEIATKYNVSVSSLAHTFRREMNISLHQFILKKRLIQAHHKIVSGTPATIAALECGFSDYSGFYRQYKKLLGFPPSGRTNSGHPTP